MAPEKFQAALNKLAPSTSESRIFDGTTDPGDLQVAIFQGEGVLNYHVLAANTDPDSDAIIDRRATLVAACTHTGLTVLVDALPVNELKSLRPSQGVDIILETHDHTASTVTYAGMNPTNAFLHKYFDHDAAAVQIDRTQPGKVAVRADQGWLQWMPLRPRTSA